MPREENDHVRRMLGSPRLDPKLFLSTGEPGGQLGPESGHMDWGGEVLSLPPFILPPPSTVLPNSARAQACPLLTSTSLETYPMDRRGLKAWYGQAINFPSVWGE